MVDQLSMFSLILSLGPPLNSWIPRGFLSGSWKQRCSYSFCCWISCVNISWSFIVFTVNMFLLVLRSKIVSLPNCFECLGKVWCLYLFLKDSVNKAIYTHKKKYVTGKLVLTIIFLALWFSLSKSDFLASWLSPMQNFLDSLAQLHALLQCWHWHLIYLVDSLPL